MFFLTLSGFYIHYPIFPGFMGLARGTHFFWMFVLLINLIVRIVLAFFVKDAIMPDTREVDTDNKNWLPQEANRHQLLPWIKYYLFLKKDHPDLGEVRRSAEDRLHRDAVPDPGSGLHRLLPVGPDVELAVLPGRHHVGRLAVQRWRRRAIRCRSASCTTGSCGSSSSSRPSTSTLRTSTTSLRSKIIFAWKETVHGEDA